VKSHDKKAIFDKFFEDHSDKPDLQAKNERQRKSLWTNAMALLREGQKIRQGSGISTTYTNSNKSRHHANQNAEQGTGFAAIFRNGTEGATAFIAGCNGLTEKTAEFMSLLTEQAKKDLGMSAVQFDNLSEEEKAKAIGNADKIGAMLKMDSVMGWKEAYERVVRAANSRGDDHSLLANAPVMSILRGFTDYVENHEDFAGVSDEVR